MELNKNVITNSMAIGYFKREAAGAILRQIGGGFLTWERLKTFVARKQGCRFIMVVDKIAEI